MAERAKLNPAGRFGDPEEFGWPARSCAAPRPASSPARTSCSTAARSRARCESGLVRANGPRARRADLWRDADAGGRPGRSPREAGGSGVNPADVGRRGGSYRAMEFPRVIPNSDGAGIIDQVGDGVTRLERRPARLAVQRPAQRPRLRYRGRIYCARRTSGDAAAGRSVVRRRRHARHSRHDRVVLPVRRWTDRGPDRAGHRRRRRRRPLCRAVRQMGRRAGHRDRQFGSEGRAGAARAAPISSSTTRPTMSLPK